VSTSAAWLPHHGARRRGGAARCACRRAGR
jgi:hypothetical protein